MEILFLAIALFKATISLYKAIANLKRLRAKIVDLPDLSQARLAELIKYHSVLMVIEAIAACMMLVSLVPGVGDMRYMFLGFLLWFTTGAIEDWTELLMHRRQKRLQQLL